MLLISLLLAICFAQSSIQEQLNEGDHVETVDIDSGDENGNPVKVEVTRVIERISRHFSDKFHCFYDDKNMYTDWSRKVYPEDGKTGNVLNKWYCCGYMANGRKQCDKLKKWKFVNGNSFTLCDNTYQEAYAETRVWETRDGGDGQTYSKPRRDLCCENAHFQDCTSCKSFVVWDFTVEKQTTEKYPDPNFGGDRVLEASYKCNEEHTDEENPIPNPEDCDDIISNCSEEENEQACLRNNNIIKHGDGNILLAEVEGKVTLKDTWRDVFYNQPSRAVDGVEYPPYAYGNRVYPAGFAQGTLREFNDPPICVYAPNVGGRVLEIRVEPEEAGSQLCVDDLLADTAEKNNPGVTQACDDVRLQTCFPDANSDGNDAGGFAFLISCSESCADGDVDLWFRLRASVNKWTEAGDEDKGTDKTEVNTEMWCMWGNQNMLDELPENVDSFKGLDGDFSRWDIYPSDLEPETDPIVRPVPSSVSYFSFAVLVSALALLF